MNILLFILLSLPFISQHAVQQNPVPVRYINQAFTLHQYGQAALTDSAALSISIINVSVGNILDSRCPKGVQCIQAGSAEVYLTISSLAGSSASLKLGVGGNRYVESHDQAPNHIVLDGITYAVTVLAVTPYPTTTNYQLPKHAKILIARI